MHGDLPCLYLIDNSALGFTLVDKKELADAVFFIALPTQIISISNLKMSFLVNLPMVVACLVIFNAYAFTIDNDNMSCYLQPEGKASMTSFRQTLLILVMAAISYMYRKSTLERFTEQEKTKKQQEQIQNLFDN